MLMTIVGSLVTLMTQFLPLVNDSTQVANFIKALVTILPAVEQLGEELVTPIKNIIAALQANATGAVTAAQLAQLQELDAQYDQAFEAAATAAEAEDNPAPAPVTAGPGTTSGTTGS